MPDPDQSPAVESLRNERAQQSKKLKRDDLDKALAETFPASDPVSVAHTSVPSGRADTDAAELIAIAGSGSSEEIPAPLVDEALDATGEGRHAPSEGAAYRREAERLAETVSDFASGSKDVAVSRAEDVVCWFPRRTEPFRRIISIEN